MPVALVGAGPGDPGLLTVRGAQLLAEAEVVVYDRLSVAELLDLAPADAERINVGKTPGMPGPTQDDITSLLVERGRQGQRVVRLKGGDPFVFARGGEEAAALEAAGVAYEVVPGITSAIAAPAYAGIPLTLRHSSTSFTVITGHEDPDKGGELDWDAVARLGGTIVILMGIGRLPKIVQRLRAAGLADDTPVASVQWGTRPEQHVVRATLGTILSRQSELAPPAVIVIGRVAAEELDWYTNRPLLGRKVVVTRTRTQASELSARLRALGAAPVEVPVIEVTDPSDGGDALQEALARVRSYDWLVLTSPNGAERLCSVLRDGRQLGDVQLAVIGPGTRDALARHRLEADLMPERYVAEGLLDALLQHEPEGGRALLVRAEVARDVLPDGLRAAGWEVDVVPAYRTVPVRPDDAQRELVADADVVTFTSSSTVTAFVESFGADAVPPIVACIGPITVATARELGVHVDIEAIEHTIEGLVAALLTHFGHF